MPREHKHHHSSDSSTPVDLENQRVYFDDGKTYRWEFWNEGGLKWYRPSSKKCKKNGKTVPFVPREKRGKKYTWDEVWRELDAEKDRSLIHQLKKLRQEHVQNTVLAEEARTFENPPDEHERSDSAAEGPKASEEPKSEVHYSKSGLDKQGKEKFETVKLKKGNKLYFSYNLMEDKKAKSGLHWARFFIVGKSPRYALTEDTTWRFVKRTLTGLSQKLLLKASRFARELYDERQKPVKK
jgi:hypothetical protein